MRALVAILLIIAITPAATAQPRRLITIAHEFHVSEGGKGTIKTLKEMNRAELRKIVAAGCAALTDKCAKLADQIKPAATIPGMVVAEGENVYITGRVLKQQDDKWWGIYPAPKGYTACRAALGKASLTTGSVFNATISSRASTPGLLFQAVVPTGAPDEPSSVHAYFLVQYAPAGSEGRLGCMPDGSNPWRCAGAGDCQSRAETVN
jgi:hypothetical protein